MMEISALEIRVRGRVQGVGFRPSVWRLARELGLWGHVANDAQGVIICAAGTTAALACFVERLQHDPPPLARIDAVETNVYGGLLDAPFRIVDSLAGIARTQVAPDMAVCAACAQEILESGGRRSRYPFTTCTHCGPRLSLITGVPYDRARTTMASFALCAPCAAEYGDPADRRFHAETTACPRCGPQATLVRLDAGAGNAQQDAKPDAVDAVSDLIQRGEIVAIKGLGGYHLACDATQTDVVERLRQRKRRDQKPFALMARDLDVIRRYCIVGPQEEAALHSPEAPIVLLRTIGKIGAASLPEAVAPGLRTLGFMLPTTPLHLLILARLEHPVVMTSGNLSDEPQVIHDEQVHQRLAEVADYALVHDRVIANRVDDSVARLLDGKIRILRRARGYAPSPIRLPLGFANAPALLAYGGELKATFCLLQAGEATLSQHQGDLEDAATFDDYRRNLALYQSLFSHTPTALVVDRHPEYRSSQLGRARATASGLPIIEVQHHHAHVASCLVENGRPLAAPPVLGIVLDGLGYGDDGTLWGGEFLLADYRQAQRIGTLQPVAMLGGAQAARQPWRNLYAHLVAGPGWDAVAASYSLLAMFQRLSDKPRATLDGMLRSGINVPLASSCGRLFDAVAAALDVCFERQAYEGEAGARLEALVCETALADEDASLVYPFGRAELPGSGLLYLEPAPMWNALLNDLVLGTSEGVIAARFHRGLARAIVAMALQLADPHGVRAESGQSLFDTVALSGGCFQNQVLYEEVCRGLRAAGFTVLSHSLVPPGDGGLALGQAAIGAAVLQSPLGAV